MVDETRSSQYEELKEIVFRTLERKGTLAKVQAQLRKNVFEALHEQECAESRQSTLPRVDEDHFDGLVLGLIAEFCTFHSLDYTLNLFQTECGLTTDLKSRVQRGQLATKLGIFTHKPEPTEPLLKQIVKKVYDNDPFTPRNSILGENKNINNTLKLRPRNSSQNNSQLFKPFFNQNSDGIADNANEKNNVNTNDDVVSNENTNNNMSGFLTSSTRPRNKKPPQQNQPSTSINDTQGDDSIFRQKFAELQPNPSSLSPKLTLDNVNLNDNLMENVTQTNQEKPSVTAKSSNDSDKIADNIDNEIATNGSKLSSLDDLPSLSKPNKLASINAKNSTKNVNRMFDRDI